MAVVCSFCSSPLPEAPPGTAVRCPSCSNVAMTPSLPPTRAMPMPVAPMPMVAPPATPTGLPFSSVDGPKQGASPPPAVVMPSRAGGVDELVGGGITILGIGVVKFVLLWMLGLGGACLLGMLGLVLHC